MPTITRGTRSRRRVEEDAIEEQETTQRSRTEEVEDAEEEEEEEQPRHTSKRSSTRGAGPKKVKKEKGKASRKRETSPIVEEKDAEDAEEENEDDGPKIDVENFRDQPLPQDNAALIKGLKGEWDVYLSNFRSTLVEVNTDVAVAMAEVGMGRSGDTARKELEGIDAMMRELLDTQAEMKAHSDTLEDIASSITTGEEIDNVIDRYEIGVTDRIEVWNSKTTRQKYGRDQKYIEFRQKIFEIQNGADEAMPPLTEFIAKEDGDDSDDEDIVVGGVSQVYTCPLTLTPLVEPMTSQVCKHTFSKASIIDYFKNNHSTMKKCPATGCNRQFMLKDLKPNKEIEKAVKAHLRRQRQREAEADSGEDDAEEIID